MVSTTLSVGVKSGMRRRERGMPRRGRKKWPMRIIRDKFSKSHSSPLVTIPDMWIMKRPMDVATITPK